MYSIGTFSKKIGVTIETLRYWDKQNKLKPAFISEGKHRYYSEEQLNELLQKKNITKRINLGYIRVSTRKQKNDLERQHQLMELYLTKQGFEANVFFQKTFASKRI